MKTLIFCDKIESYAELCAGGKTLGGEVTAYFIGGQDMASKCPADKVYYTEAQSEKPFEDYFDTFMEAVSKVSPNVIMISATKRGKFMAAKVAAALKTSAITDITSLKADGENVVATKMYYGGLAVNTLKSKGIAVLTVGVGFFDKGGANAAGEVLEIPFKVVSSGVTRKEIRKKEGETVNLAAAKKVVGVGRGIAKKEDLQLARDLAAVIGAEIGCSRPIAEGEGWMTTDRYIGVSGVILKPDVYVALGLSGQIQHTIGVNSSKIIIAVNKDKNAPIFKACDYGIVGDLYKIVPELVKNLKG